MKVNKRQRVWVSTAWGWVPCRLNPKIYGCVDYDLSPTPAGMRCHNGDDRGAGWGSQLAHDRRLQQIAKFITQFVRGGCVACAIWASGVEGSVRRSGRLTIVTPWISTRLYGEPMAGAAGCVGQLCFTPHRPCGLDWVSPRRSFYRYISDSANKTEVPWNISQWDWLVATRQRGNSGSASGGGDCLDAMSDVYKAASMSNTKDSGPI
jgi:hypothetical protein